MKLNRWPLMIISDHQEDNFETHRLKHLINALKKTDITIIYSPQIHDIVEICTTKRDISAVVVDWNINESIEARISSIRALKEKFSKLPVIIIAEKTTSEELPLEILNTVDGYYWLNDDTVTFMAGRINHAANTYVANVYPPFFKALKEYAETYKYAWHTPGHMGGEGFLKSAAGTAFYHFFGENVMRSDLSVSVPELGSLLDHSGVIKESEKLAATTFNSDLSYFILNGTSTANQVIWRSQVSNNDIALVDRNCHKSLNYAIVITGAIPVYMTPRRNNIGIIGPVRLSEFTKTTGLEKLKKNPLISKDTLQSKFKMSALTNSTYDGVCYNVRKIKQQLENHVSYLHFDEAWYAYAKFHQVYEGFYGMADDILENKNHPPVFCSQSTHKLLTAFSQASMIHIKQGTEEKIVQDEFNESYMMHGSTSPNYPLIASLDVATQMMRDDGAQMSEDNILDAISLRQKVQVLYYDFKNKGDWFFKMWQPEQVLKEHKLVQFTALTPKELADEQNSWILKNKDDWHGFDDIEEDFIMLDPIKLTFLMPGVDENGNYEAQGIPATIVSDFLINKGIVVEKSDTYSFLILHSFGTTKGKQGELLAALLEFKRLYDNNTSLEAIFPKLYENNIEYLGMGLKDLCDKMHKFYSDNDFLKVMHGAFENIPSPVMKPADAFQNVVRKNVSYVYLDDMMNRMPAVMLVPYPPGIPVIMGGEILDKSAKNIYDYLRLLQQFENEFHGYEKDIHGIERDIKNNKIYYKTLCINK
ncbi:Orn/Lys/Arg decarboxylase N-terminal domain-containing protein [Cellulophaga sp. Z1A5H]|uniref:Orn/Lys/Arg family decarboxylase n=1 Tax=Cellulophaga sp. Z1A5H TaxID=2687291 RepID=UPI0013FD467B|nr:Orn/Lys/Arg decarboxylase N-terminal domain-containing protein [Cellulophaga sp. Z1A5H]